MSRRSTTWLVWLLLPLGVAAAEERPRIAVLDLRADVPLGEGTRNTLDEILLTEFHRSGRFAVLGMADIASMLTLEEERIKLSGCADDSCLAQIGGALGVQLVAAASVGAVGDRFFVSVKLLDVGRARVLARHTTELPRDEARLVEALRETTSRVIRGAGLGRGSQPGAGDSALAVVPWLTLGVTVAAGAAGGVLGGRTVGNDDWSRLQDERERKALAADVLFGVAGAAAVATVVLFLVGGDADAAPRAAVVPVRGGVAATLGARLR